MRTGSPILVALLALCVCGNANAQQCANSTLWDFDLPVYSLVAGYPNGATQADIEELFREVVTRDTGLNDASCCQGINVRVLPSTLPASCLTVTAFPPESENLESCSLASGPFSITIVDSIPVCGGSQNVDACWEGDYGYAIFIARNNASWAENNVQALATILARTAIARRSQNPFIIGSSAPVGDLFGVGFPWTGDVSTASCMQMQAWSTGLLSIPCPCAPTCITDNGDAPPQGQSCLVDGVGPILTCSHGVCDGPPGSDCLLKGGDFDGDGICNDGDGSGSIHADDICGFAGATLPNCDDNCPNPPRGYNPDQASSTEDGDTWGDACDMCPHDFDTAMGPDYYQEDTDFDNVPDACDNCSDERNPVQEDFDGDRAGDACDNCITVPNIQTENADGDAVGDECDSTPYPPGNPLNADADGDGMPLYLEQLAGTSDNDADSDNDGISASASFFL